MRWHYCPECDPPARTTKYDPATLEPVRRGRRTGTKVRAFMKGSPQRLSVGATRLDDIDWTLSYADWWYDPRVRHLVETGAMIDPAAITEPVADEPDRIERQVIRLAITCPNGHPTNLFRDHQRVTAAIERLGDRFMDIWNRTGHDIDLIELELDDEWTARRNELREILKGLTESQRAAARTLYDGCSVYDLDAIAAALDKCKQTSKSDHD
jgi:hypothetical protein